MNSRFFNWYTQAFGSCLGILVCIFAYVNGWMFVYGNINPNFDNMHINGIISSYLLLPLCIITLCSSFVKLYFNDKYIFNISLLKINTFICMLTVIIGIIGTNIYFIIPSCFIFEETMILFIKSIKLNKELKNKKNTIKEEVFENEGSLNESEYENGNTINYNSKSSIDKNIKLKKEMAINLLEKDADIQFIREITGLTSNDIDELKRNLCTK